MVCCKCGHIRDVDGLELGEWTVKWRGAELKLMPVEHAALKRLTVEPGHLIHWTFLGSYTNSRTIISRLRAAFERVDPGFNMIATVRSKGWRWAV